MDYIKIINGSKTYIDHVVLLVSGIFTFFLPLDFYVLSYFIGLMVLVGLFQFNKLNIQENIYKYKYSFMFFVFLFIWQSLSLIWSSDFSNGIKSIGHRAFFIVAPLLFLLFKKWPSDKIIKIFIISNFLVCLICFGNLISFFVNEKMYFIEKTINKGISLETFSYISYHSSVNFFPFDAHRLYFSFSLLSCLLFIFFYNNIIKYQYLLSFIFVFVIFLLQSKISVILLIILLFYKFYKKFRQSSIKMRVSILFISVVIICIGFYLSKIRFNHFINEISVVSENREGSLIERYQYSKCSIELIRESPFFGYGVGDIDNVIKEKLIKYNYSYLIEKGVYDPHNEFLKSYIGMGVIGFVLFVSIFICLFYKSYREKNIVLFFYTGFVFIICLIEPFLSRQAGILPVLFFVGIISNKERSIIK
ncbi:O-antigen ligase family protein [Thalassobellus citreus]|uniref:O-antigen ligase family protein n=1 Tax=Thalassobellus citreus TaxID=3367752 RepID=UPI00378CB341